jgi:hypothetical protein
MSMRRFAIFFLAAILISPAGASAAVKPGDVCKKVGTISTVKNVKYTCIKSGKKLVWNSGVKIPIPKASATTQSSATDFKFISFSAVAENSSKIPGVAYALSQKLITTEPINTPDVQYFFGPNTKPIDVNYKETFAFGYKFFGNYPQPKSITMLFYNFQDRSWAEGKFTEITTDPNVERISKNCQNKEQCGGADALPMGLGVGHINFGSEKAGPITQIGVIGLHEYFHLIQWGLNQTPPNMVRMDLVPCWLREGQAHFFGHVAAIRDFPTYLSLTNDLVRAYPQPWTSFSAPTIEKFLDTSCDGPAYGHSYDVGFFAVEALAAFAGPDSTIQLTKMITAGTPFENSFEKIYGKPWLTAKKDLSLAIANQFVKGHRA